MWAFYFPTTSLDFFKQCCLICVYKSRILTLDVSVFCLSAAVLIFFTWRCSQSCPCTYCILNYHIWKVSSALKGPTYWIIKCAQQSQIAAPRHLSCLSSFAYFTTSQNYLPATLIKAWNCSCSQIFSQMEQLCRGTITNFLGEIKETATSLLVLNKLSR